MSSFWGLMDRFFVCLIMLSGEEEWEDTNINHIL